MDYEQFKIRSYDLWDLYLHKEQYPYIGRCYAAAKRKDAENVVQITGDEAKELFTTIVPNWFATVEYLFNASWPNVAILGNDWRHLHAHLIPRYFSPREVFGYTFTDPRPTKNYAPYDKVELPVEILYKIRDAIADN